VFGGRLRGRTACLATLALLALAGCQSGAGGGSQAASPVTVAPQRGWDDAIIYFVLVDRFADGDSTNNPNVQPDNPGGWHGGDLKGLAQRLDEIADLGATAIWINPVQLQIAEPVFASGPAETGTQAGFEHWGFHGYWMEDFARLDPQFGTEEDLRALVEAAHARGIKVLLDVVYNHAGYGARYVTDPKYAGWIRRKPVDCGADPLTCQVGGLPDFVTENPEVADYLLSATIGIAERTGVDGFRLDTVKHIDHPFWQLHRARTRTALGDDFFLLGEVWGGSWQVLDEWFVNDELDAGFDFTFRGCLGFVQGRGRSVAFASYLEKRHRVRDGYHLAHYLSSHDEPMALYELGYDKDRFRLCAALQMTSFGITVIYYGEEVGRDGSVWPTNRKNMPWGYRDIEPGGGVARDEDLRDYYKRLIEIRREHQALSRGDFTRLYTEGDLLVFQRVDEASGDAVVVALNRGSEAASVEVPVPGIWEGRAVRELLTGSSASSSGGQLRVDVPALETRIYAP
jgi:alpha-amylase